MQFSILHSCIK